MIFDPLHFLPLLKQKVGALDQAVPLKGWDLPDQFATLRRLLEARMGKKGRREYVQVLRLLETFEIAHGSRAGTCGAVMSGSRPRTSPSQGGPGDRCRSAWR